MVSIEIDDIWEHKARQVKIKITSIIPLKGEVIETTTVFFELNEIVKIDYPDNWKLISKASNIDDFYIELLDKLDKLYHI